jgi:hypothetical protein
MPVISMFYGVIIAMYFADNKKHNRPHIHVKFQGQEAVYGIPEGDLIEGSIPPGKARLVVAWIELHKDDLMANWDLASESQPIFKIEPLH